MLLAQPEFLLHQQIHLRNVGCGRGCRGPYGKKLMFFSLMIVDFGTPLSTSALTPTIVPHGKS